MSGYVANEDERSFESLMATCLAEPQKLEDALTFGEYGIEYAWRNSGTPLKRDVAPFRRSSGVAPFLGIRSGLPKFKLDIRFPITEANYRCDGGDLCFSRQNKAHSMLMGLLLRLMADTN